MHPTLQGIFTRNACFFIVVLKYSHYVRKKHCLSTITAVAAKNEERFARPIKQYYTIPYLRMHCWREILPWDWSKPRFFSARHHLGMNTHALLAHCHSFRGTQEHNTNPCTNLQSLRCYAIHAKRRIVH